MSLKPSLGEIPHNTDEKIMDQVRSYAEEFMESEYPDEAPYFDIAWDNFAEALQDNRDDDWGLKGPTVRDAKGHLRLEDDIIMAPMVIRAFHLLFTATKRMESEDNEIFKQKMVQFLSEKKFSLDFSMKIASFFVENRRPAKCRIKR